MVEDVFEDEKRLVEKYNVVKTGKKAEGRYEGQTGFGWTNGV